MSMIESDLKSVNERCPNRGAKYVGCNTVLHYLDKKFPKWRIEIKNREEWKVAFEFDICIRPDDNMLAFADELFDIIGNTEAEMFAWSNKECNEFYRYVAIQRLRKIDEAGYLPQYIDELKKGNFEYVIEDDLVYYGNEKLIRNLFTILLDNARKYSKTYVDFTLSKTKNKIRI